MTTDMVIGLVAGGGWGALGGFLFGVAWLRQWIREMGEEPPT